MSFEEFKDITNGIACIVALLFSAAVGVVIAWYLISLLVGDFVQ